MGGASPVSNKGRHKKTTSDLPTNWAKKLLELGKVGGSESEMRITLGCISDDLWYRLKKEDPEFSRTVSIAKLLAQGWWERKGRENIENTKFNTRLWQINMMNRFNWLKEETASKGVCFKCLSDDARKKYGL